MERLQGILKSPLLRVWIGFIAFFWIYNTFHHAQLITIECEQSYAMNLEYHKDKGYAFIYASRDIRDYIDKTYTVPSVFKGYFTEECRKDLFQKQ